MAYINFIQQVKSFEIGTLKKSLVKVSSILYYLKGNCTWRVAIDIGLYTAEDVSVGPQLLLENSDRYEITCKVNNSVKLHAMIVVLGELIHKYTRQIHYFDMKNEKGR